MISRIIYGGMVIIDSFMWWHVYHQPDSVKYALVAAYGVLTIVAMVCHDADRSQRQE